MKRVAKVAISLFVLGLIALIVLPQWAPVNAVSWTPPYNPGLTGVFATNQALSVITEVPVGTAPEHVACDAQGRLYTSLDGGAVLRSDIQGEWLELGNTAGRPLGLRPDGQSGLWIADSMAGLLHMDVNGDITLLATDLDGVPLRFVDDLDVDSNGRIWFSDASQRFDYTQVALDFFEGSRTGRLLRFDPATQQTDVMMDGLFFANGVTLGPNEDYVLINETGMGRVHRLWLKGEKLVSKMSSSTSYPARRTTSGLTARTPFGLPCPHCVLASFRWPRCRAYERCCPTCRSRGLRQPPSPSAL